MGVGLAAPPASGQAWVVMTVTHAVTNPAHMPVAWVVMTVIHAVTNPAHMQDLERDLAVCVLPQAVQPRALCHPVAEHGE